ncbi:hypothetical protein BKA65DRAFT_500203 [Rhexocercosporidium sp. MPI-PUGE-AT-0058]|nr:hypothetical protein BKA65DRAFT_500203 [Rhexocercosporidium sp. MPI-PUGE-AT-0058]
MNLKPLLSTAIFAVSVIPTLACLQTAGVVGQHRYDGTWAMVYAYSIDNGLTTCNTQWGYRIDQDGHFSLSCLPGYVYAFTQNGAVAWYANPVNAFSFTQNPLVEWTSNYVVEWEWSDSHFGC